MKKTKAKKNTPKQKRKNYDWEVLFEEFCKSGLKKAEFLRTKGINPSSGAACRNTNSWTRDVHLVHKQMELADEEFKKEKEKLYRQHPRVPNRKPDGVIVKDEINEIYQLVNTWRKGQAANDYRLAEKIRQHIRIVLDNAMNHVVSKVTGKDLTSTKLTPMNIRALVNSLEGLQKIQRLALGMSTENVGFEGQIKKADNQEDECPIFEVEVSKEGRFLKARPTQIQGEKIE